MTILLLILLAAAGGFVLGQLWRTRPSGETPPPAPLPSEPPKALSAPDMEALTTRLYALESEFSGFGSNAAHPSALLTHPKFKEAVAALADPAVPLGELLRYAEGGNWGLACAALAALKERPERAEARDRVGAMCENLVPWSLHFAYERLCEGEDRLPVGAPLLGVKDWWIDNSYMPMFCRDYLARRAELGDEATFGPALKETAPHQRATVRSFLRKVQHPSAAALVAEIEALDPPETASQGGIAGVGRFWDAQQGTEVLVEPEGWRDLLTDAEASLARNPPRSLLVAGEPMAGKTAFLKLLARRVAGTGGWRVLEAGGADLQAGQIYIGQLEGRIREILDELAAGKRIVWYIPDLVQLARSGTHQGQSASMLDQIRPAIAAGRLVVWSEATPAGAARLVQLQPSLRSLIEVAVLEPMPPEEALPFLREVADEIGARTGIAIEPGSADVALESARQYLGARALPGSAILMLKLAVARAAQGRKEVTPSAVLETLAQLSGLPLSILDTRERLDLNSIRAFFGARVMGQPEAVNAIVERIAMLKAGLNDPERPIGVFLFAGPTGTGKTELAKAAAEFLFGSDERLVRLDMSEFQTPESMAKIIGSAGGPMEADSLIARVRKQPFSVLLLDEFEKSHPMIWDLFLQAFDEGRLTDAMGLAADLRHCLIILTSNLGATAHRSLGLGFAPQADAFTAEQVMRAISQTFRPEFQNRLDKVIIFNPLTRDLMREILRKELARLIERRGFRDRAWAVEWESSALEFLLEKGFSPEMGARPLKRAIEEYVIAPIAALIVEQKFPEGDQFVFVRSDGRAIQAEFVDPDADAAADKETAAAAEPGALAGMILAPSGDAQEFRTLGAHLSEAEAALASDRWTGLKAALSSAMAAPGFWDRPDRFGTLALFALMDRVKAATETARSLQERLSRSARADGACSPELVARLALQLHLVRDGIRDALEGAPVEVALSVEPVFDAGADRQQTLAWCGRLLAMYRAWGGRRRMHLSELADVGSGPVLLVGGFGCHRVLSRESGLHVFEAVEGGEKLTARVRLTVVPPGDVPAAKAPRLILQALEDGAASNAIVRRYREEPPLVRNADGLWRSGRLDLVLGGDFDLLGPEAPAAGA